MTRLLAVFLESETNVRKATNLWRTRTFNVLGSHDSISLKDVDDTRTDTHFRNKPARIAYENLIAVTP